MTDPYNNFGKNAAKRTRAPDFHPDTPTTADVNRIAQALADHYSRAANQNAAELHGFNASVPSRR